MWGLGFWGLGLRSTVYGPAAGAGIRDGGPVSIASCVYLVHAHKGIFLLQADTQSHPPVKTGTPATTLQGWELKSLLMS